MKYIIKRCDELVVDFEKQLSTISQYRQNAVNSAKQQNDKVRSLAVTLLLDEILAEYGLNESEMSYSQNEHKKPYFDNKSNLHFNLSHSKDYAAVAVSDNEVGIDIEQKRDVNLKIAKRFFTENECDYIKSTDDFFRIWVLKESFIKAIGKGLACPLNSFEVRGLDKIPFVFYNGKKYSFTEIQAAEYKAAICMEVEI